MIEVFIPDYIIQISNSQHGWISIVIINNQCYDWGFQSRFSTTAIIFINGHDFFYNGGNSPESLQAYDPALGGYIIQVKITCKSHVAASMHHDTWGLMQSHFYWPYWRPDSSYHNEPALGGYQLLLSTIQVLWASVNYKSQVAASMTTRHLGATYMEYSVYD